MTSTIKYLEDYMKKLTKLITTFAVISAIGTTMLSSTVAAEKHRGNNNSTRYNGRRDYY